jgi:hypothetical protein
VLTDASVEGAGEIVAVAFRGRADTRSFGAPTCGVATGIEFHVLDYAHTLGIASARLADRTGVQYHRGVPVDEAIDDGNELLAAAYAWLRSDTP